MKPPQAQPTEWSRMAETISRHFFLKGVGTMLFIALFFGAYFYLRTPSSITLTGIATGSVAGMTRGAPPPAANVIEPE